MSNLSKIAYVEMCIKECEGYIEATEAEGTPFYRRTLTSVFSNSNSQWWMTKSSLKLTIDNIGCGGKKADKAIFYGNKLLTEETPSVQDVKAFVLLLQELLLEVKKEELLTQFDKSDAVFELWAIIHDDIEAVSKLSFNAGDYASAVNRAFVEINDRIKKIYFHIENKELDGTPLMQKVFSYDKQPNGDVKNPPLICLDDLSTGSGRNVQEGYKNIFAGAIQAIRNPNAHENLPIKRDDAIRKLMMASDLMYRIDVVDNLIK